MSVDQMLNARSHTTWLCPGCGVPLRLDKDGSARTLRSVVAVTVFVLGLFCLWATVLWYIEWVVVIMIVMVPLFLILPSFFDRVTIAYDKHPGYCSHCTYDLRGLPDDTTHCPECGRPVDPPSTKGEQT